MLRFAVYDDDGPARLWPLRHAHVFGQDDIAVNADIVFADGVITCKRRSGEPAGLSLQWPITPGAGLLTLRTCLLPERTRPYLLSLELARHKLMASLNVLEDWAMFDLPADDPLMRRLADARKAFTLAVIAQRPTTTDAHAVEADRLGRNALKLAVELAEGLALRNSKTLYDRRMSGELARAAATIRAPSNALTNHEAAEGRNRLLGTVGAILTSPPAIGCAIGHDDATPELRESVKQSCDFIRLPMRWTDMEPVEGRYAFSRTDKWIEWAVRDAKLPIVGGPLVDFRPGAVPQWLFIWEHDYETLRELVYEHVRQVVTRYRRTVGSWIVCGGMNVNAGFNLALEQIADLTRLSISVVRKLQPQARISIEIDLPFGEYHASSTFYGAGAGVRRSIPPTTFAEMIQQSGLGVDEISLRLEVGQPEPGRSTRDLLAISTMLDRFALAERPIRLSAVSAPSAPHDVEHLGLEGQLEPGWWRDPWSPQAQCEWATAVLAIAASKPFVHSACWSQLRDPADSKHNRHDGLLQPDGSPKPVFNRFIEIRKAILERRWPMLLEPAIAQLACIPGSPTPTHNAKPPTLPATPSHNGEATPAANGVTKTP